MPHRPKYWTEHPPLHLRWQLRDLLAAARALEVSQVRLSYWIRFGCLHYTVPSSTNPPPSPKLLLMNEPEIRGYDLGMVEGYNNVIMHGEHGIHWHLLNGQTPLFFQDPQQFGARVGEYECLGMLYSPTFPNRSGTAYFVSSILFTI